MKRHLNRSTAPWEHCAESGAMLSDEHLFMLEDESEVMEEGSVAALSRAFSKAVPPPSTIMFQRQLPSVPAPAPAQSWPIVETPQMPANKPAVNMHALEPTLYTPLVRPSEFIHTPSTIQSQSSQSSPAPAPVLMLSSPSIPPAPPLPPSGALTSPYSTPKSGCEFLPPIPPFPQLHSRNCAITNCTTLALRTCIYCGEGFCEAHTPASAFPDARGVLSYRCPHCAHRKSTGGVTYVEKTESRQACPLSHPSYQPFHIGVYPSQAGTDAFEHAIKGGAMLASILPDDEDLVKEYCLQPFRRYAMLRHPVELLRGLRELKPHIIDKRVVLLHFVYDPERLILPLVHRSGPNGTMVPPVEQSNIFMWVMTRKAMSFMTPAKKAKKDKDRAMREELGLTAAQMASLEDGKGPSVHARLELLVDRLLWERLSNERRAELRYLQTISEDHLHELLNIWNTARPPNTREPTMSMVSTRESYRIRLAGVPTIVHPASSGRSYTRTDWYFPHESIPDNYDAAVHGAVTSHGAPAGVITYNDVFTSEEMSRIERSVDQLDTDGRLGKFNHLPATRQESCRGAKLVRTKFFFGARYLWTAEQMADKRDASRAAGVRADVCPPPEWLRSGVEEPLVQTEICPEGFVNSIAVNIYHDGTEGLHQHYDDMKRFNQPIFSLRVFSDCRLAFGAHGLSMSNPLYFVPMPRGCVTVMLDKSYSANAIKHCIRPSDMSEKSAAIILRQIHPKVMQEAEELLKQAEVSRWLCTIPGLDNAVQYGAAFSLEGITMASLPFLTECDLKILGVHLMGPRKLIANAISALRGSVGAGASASLEHKICSCDCPNYAFAVGERPRPRRAVQPTQLVVMSPNESISPLLMKRLSSSYILTTSPDGQLTHSPAVPHAPIPPQSPTPLSFAQLSAFGATSAPAQLFPVLQAPTRPQLAQSQTQASIGASLFTPLPQLAQPSLLQSASSPSVPSTLLQRPQTPLPRTVSSPAVVQPTVQPTLVQPVVQPSVVQPITHQLVMPSKPPSPELSGSPLHVFNKSTSPTVPHKVTVSPYLVPPTSRGTTPALSALPSFKPRAVFADPNSAKRPGELSGSSDDPNKRLRPESEYPATAQ